MKAQTGKRWGILIFFLMLAFLFWVAPLVRADDGQEVYMPIIPNDPSLTPTLTLTPTVTPTLTLTPSTPPKQNWLTYVNWFRGIAGVPAVNDDATLSNNCWEHARYMGENLHLTHYQDPSKPYASAAGQICAGNGNAWLGWGTGWQSFQPIDGWMSSTGHRLWLLYPTTPTFGFGFYQSSNSSKGAGAAMDVLSRANFDADAAYSGWPIRYPASNQINIPPSRYPITLLWRYFGVSPTVTSTNLVTSGGTSLSHSVSTSLAAVHKGVEIIPASNLPTNTRITVTINGTYNGASFSYTWSFTTAVSADVQLLPSLVGPPLSAWKEGK